MPEGAVRSSAPMACRERWKTKRRCDRFPPSMRLVRWSPRSIFRGDGTLLRAEVVFIGHAGHPEVEGTLGQIDGEVHLVETKRTWIAPAPPDTPIAYVTQTTLSVDDTRGVIAPCIAVSSMSRGRKSAIFAMLRKIGRARCANCPGSPTSLSWLGPERAPTPIGCRKSERRPAPGLYCGRQRRDRCRMGAQCGRCRSDGRRFGARDRRRGRGSDLNADQAV